MKGLGDSIATWSLHVSTIYEGKHWYVLDFRTNLHRRCYQANIPNQAQTVQAPRHHNTQCIMLQVWKERGRERERNVSRHRSWHVEWLGEAKQVHYDPAPFHQGTTITDASLVQVWRERDKERERDVSRHCSWHSKPLDGAKQLHHDLAHL